MKDVKQILKALDLQEINDATSSGGRWSRSSEGSAIIESRSPATGELIAKVQASTAEDYEQVVADTRAAFEQWRLVPAPKRGEAVRLIGEELRKHKDALGSLVSLEMGKIKAEGDGEVQEMIDIADFAVGQARMLYGKTMHSERPHHRMYEQWHPIGLVGIISAFNFPVAVWSWNAFIAAVCGNACIWKPSPKTPLCAIAVQRICNRVLELNKYPAIFSLFIDADNTVAERLVADRRVELISFTGSTAVGRKVARIVAERMGKVLLELGGNNAIVVDEQANLDLVVPAVLFGAVGTAGQRCTTTRRLLVHEKLVSPLTQRLVHAYKQVRIGDPLDPETLMGPLIDHAAVERYESAVAAVRAAGGEVLVGGHALDRRGNFVEPTIATGEERLERRAGRDLRADPVRHPVPHARRGDCPAQRRPQGLSSSIFTNDVQHAESFPVRGRQRLRHRQRQHRHVGRGDRWCVRRREGHGWRTRGRIGLVGRHTCGGRRTRSTGGRSCRSRRGSSSRWSERPPAITSGCRWLSLLIASGRIPAHSRSSKRLRSRFLRT
jgi:aldehyde dehydrogenase (NAD+)